MAGFPDIELAPGFQTTHWEDLRAVRTSTPEHRQAVLEGLARRYWAPVYWYVRTNGIDHTEALDATQDFFVYVVLERDLFGRAEQVRGRFRAFLLQALKNFQRDRRRHTHAERRCPDGLVLSLDRWTGSEGRRLDLPAPDSNPEVQFHWKWAATLLEQVLADLERSCQRAGLASHFAIFRERVIRPALYGDTPTPTEELADRYGLTPKQVANRTETIRRRFRKLLLQEVSLTVGNQAEVEDEIRVLMGYLRQQRR